MVYRKKYPVPVTLHERSVAFFQPMAATPTPSFAVIGLDVTIPTTPLSLAPLKPGWQLRSALAWTASILYNGNGRNDMVTFSGMSDVWSPVQIDFQGNIQGGVISLSISAPVVEPSTGQSDTVKWSGEASIIGLNPLPHDVVRAQLPSLLLQVIAYKETLSGQRFQQFNTDGSPVFGGPRGFGIMQLDPPDTARQIWDWKQNVAGGIQRFQTAQRVALNNMNAVRSQHPGMRILTDDELGKGAATYYNGGGANGFYWIPNADFTDWIRNPNSSGNSSFAKALNYGDDTLNVLTSCRSGSFPSDW